MPKRLFDIFFSLAGLMVMLLPFGVIGLLIKVDSPGPVLYRGVRSGRWGRPFRIYKFRTMVKDAEKMGGPSTALNDPRLTRVGKFLRKYKIDEFPQLINILRGDMSFVGPRPQVVQYTSLYNDEEKIILSVKPGLTDYASIKFIHLDSLLGDEGVDAKYLREIEPEKNRLRMEYARHHSFGGDLKILFQTIVQMMKIRSLWNTDH